MPLVPDRPMIEDRTKKPDYVVVCPCCCKTFKTPIMDPMQKSVLVWAGVGFVIALWYLALSLGAWLAVSWIWTVVWIVPK